MAKQASLAAIAILALLFSGPAHADQALAIEIDHPIGWQPPAVVPIRAAEASNLPLANVLPAARIGAFDQLETMKTWNAAGHSPVQNGFTRRLPSALLARLDSRPDQAGDRALSFESSLGDRIWTTSIQVDQADRIRLHLENVRVRPGTLFTIWGAGDAPRTFGMELDGPGGDIWTPSVSGERAFLEVRLPKPDRGADEGFEIREVAQIFLDAPLAGECLIDATCVSASSFAPIESLRKAIAHIEFIKDSGLYACSGGLLNATDATNPVPYFLTANHCISSQTVASTLEAFWDDKTSTCDGTFPNLASLPRSTGATLLATSVQSDFAFLRLLAVPAGRIFLGWTSDTVAPATLLTRLSHPIPAGAVFPQSFSSATYTASPTYTCRTDSDGRPWGDLTKFLYSIPATGGIYGGSSGSPVVNPAGQVVGQLLGICGTSLEGCSSEHYIVDGSFANTYFSISQYLNPATGDCVPDATTACLLNGRFQATVRYRGSFDNFPADTNASLKPVTGFASPGFESSFFYFNSVNNIEILLKMLDQGNTDSQGHPTIAVLFGSATPLRTEITITDTLTGAFRTYVSPFNTQQGATDFTAFIK